MTMDPADVNCAEMCVNGCILGDQCPHQAYTEQATKFINETPLDQILAIAEAAVRRKATERLADKPQWVFPEDGIQPPQA